MAEQTPIQMTPEVARIIDAIGVRNPKIIEFVSLKLSQMENINPETVDLIVSQLRKNPISTENIRNNRPRQRKRPRSGIKIPLKLINRNGPVSSYSLFVNLMHKKLIEIDKDITFSQRAVIISNVWCMMSQKDKEPFKYAAQEANNPT